MEGVPVSGDLVLVPRGLVTTPNERGVAPKGSMRRAKNVVIRRAGIVEPRPGFSAGGVGAAPSGFDQRVLVSWNNIVIVAGYHSSGWRAYYTSATQITGEWTPPDPSRLRLKHAIARGAMYYTSTQGVRKLETNAATASEAAGIPPPRPVPFVNTVMGVTGVAVADDRSVAYRVVTKRRDANGYEERSIPSQRVIYRNASGVTRNPVVQIDSLVGAKAGDVIEVYRSRAFAPSTATPDDELFLVATLVLDSTQATNLSTSNSLTTDINDTTPDGGGGQALYTNPTQETLLGGNRPPPYCHDIVEFKRSVFYLRTKSRPYVKLDLVDIGGTTADGFFSDTGFQSRTFTGDVAVGVAQITNVASNVGLVAGMVIGDGTNESPFNPGVRINTNTKIVSVTGAGPYTINLDKPATATAVGQTYTAGDVVTVNGTDIVGGFTRAGHPNFRIRGAAAGYTASMALGETAEGLAAAINSELLGVYAYAEGLDGGGQQTVIIERIDDYAGTLTLATNRAAAFAPALASLAAITDQQPAGYAWSKADRPAAVPLSQYSVCGDLSEPILRAIATRDSLFIFKSDGIFRLTGAGAASGWSVAPLAPGVVLIAPDSCAVIGDAVFAWTNEGVCIVTEAGIQNISQPRISELLYGYERDLSVVPAQSHVPWGVANRKDGEYVLGVNGLAAGDTAFDLPTATAYVWNTDTETWVEWPILSKHMIASDVGDLLVYALGAWGVIAERSDETIVADDEYAISITSSSAGAITIAAASGWTPAEGDAIKQGATIARVRTVASPTQFTVEPVQTFAVAAATAYVAFESDVEFSAQMTGRPGVAKVWGAAQWFFRTALQLYRMTLEYTSDLPNASDKADVTPGLTEAVDRAIPARSWVPRAHSWSANLYPRLRITNALARWAFEGLELEAEADSAGTRRTYGA